LGEGRRDNDPQAWHQNLAPEERLDIGGPAWAEPSINFTGTRCHTDITKTADEHNWPAMLGETMMHGYCVCL
jgi:hypothetical protein